MRTTDRPGLIRLTPAAVRGELLVVRHDGVDDAVPDIAHEPLVLRPGLAAVSRAVVVDVDTRDLPAPTLRESPTVLLLTLHPESLAFTVVADPRVDGS